MLYTVASATMVHNFDPNVGSQFANKDGKTSGVQASASSGSSDLASTDEDLMF
jgi:hypothetical protein